jgi:hypothetical protein
LEILGRVGISNFEVGLDEKLGDSEKMEKDLNKEPNNEKPSSSSMTPS